jgi:hypothetical protein
MRFSLDVQFNIDIAVRNVPKVFYEQDAPLDLTPNTRYVITIQELKSPSPSGDAW